MDRQIKLDKFGRVLIPKRVRDDLGIGPGTRLTIEERANEVVLRPTDETPRLAKKGRVLVAEVKPTGDLEAAVAKGRLSRLAKLTGG